MVMRYAAMIMRHADADDPGYEDDADSFCRGKDMGRREYDLVMRKSFQLAADALEQDSLDAEEMDTLQSAAIMTWLMRESVRLKGNSLAPGGPVPAKLQDPGIGALFGRRDCAKQPLR